MREETMIEDMIKDKVKDNADSTIRNLISKNQSIDE